MAVFIPEQPREAKVAYLKVPPLPLFNTFTPKEATLTRSPEKGTIDLRLYNIYLLMSQGKSERALRAAVQLKEDFPNFQLGHLVYADLLQARFNLIQEFGSVDTKSLQKISKARLSPLSQNQEVLTADQVRQYLKEEFRLRQHAASKYLSPSSFPNNFLRVAPKIKHVIAIDASHSRLYILENTVDGLHPVKDFYVSIGKSGLDKSVEGDEKTPLGVYFTLGTIDVTQMQSFYGSGALPINYPNAYDRLIGKTGSGIWLHGTPEQQFSRFPLSSNGCLVIANPDLITILKTVDAEHTPVVITDHLNWVENVTINEYADFTRYALEPWLQSRNQAQSITPQIIPARYTTDTKKNLANTTIKNLSLIQWTQDGNTLMLADFELLSPQGTKQHRQQYWIQDQQNWLLFAEEIPSGQR
jgi:L,D-peptidoglycan transpeptidase YkuD (ErfK/YbiS/YcfS/YnhG family)